MVLHNGFIGNFIINKGEKMFDTHKLNDKGFAEVKRFKETMSVAVSLVLNDMPEGREKSLFKTQIETAMFFGTKAIAGKEGNFTEIVKYTTF
jgi:hypothetical protein